MNHKVSELQENLFWILDSWRRREEAESGEKREGLGVKGRVNSEEEGRGMGEKMGKGRFLIHMDIV